MTGKNHPGEDLEECEKMYRQEWIWCPSRIWNASGLVGAGVGWGMNWASFGGWSQNYSLRWETQQRAEGWGGAPADHCGGRVRPTGTVCTRSCGTLPSGRVRERGFGSECSGKPERHSVRGWHSVTCVLIKTTHCGGLLGSETVNFS